MPTGTELDIMKVIAGEGGETTAGAVARKLRSWDIDYLRLICNALARQGYIEPFKSREPLAMTAKGWRVTGVGELEAERKRKASLLRQKQRGKGRTISLDY